MNRRTRLVAGGALVAALAAALWLLLTGGPSAEEPGPALVGRPPARPIEIPRAPEAVAWEEEVAPIEGPPAALAYRWRAGEVRRYAVAFEQDLAMETDPGRLGARGESAARRTEIRIAGDLTFSTYEASPRGNWVGARLSDVSAGTGRGPATLPGELRDQIGLEALLQLDAVGRPLAVVLPREATVETKNFLQGVLLYFQVVLPGPGGDPSAWTAREDDGTGPYEARYRTTGHRDGAGRAFARIEKERGAYERLHARGADRFAGEAAGRALAWFDLEGGFVRSVEAAAEVRIEVAAIGHESASRTRGTLVLEETGDDGLAGADRAARLAEIRRAGSSYPVGSTALVEEIAREAERRRVEKRLEGASLAGLAAAFAAGEGKGGAFSREEAEAFGTLVLLLRKDAASAEAAEGAILAGSVGPRAARALVDALGSAGTPWTERALAEVLRSPDLEPGLAATAIRALSASSAATPEAEGLLLEIATDPARGDLAGAALLGLGTMARTLRDRSDARAGGLASWFEGRLGDAADEAERRRVIAAIGNAGTDENAGRVVDALAGEDAAERAVAATALRHMKGERAEESLASALAADPSAAVRCRAAESLRGRTSTRAKAALREAAAAGDETVRVAAVESLGSIVRDDPATYDFLAALAIDASQPGAVRRAAFHALGIRGE